MADLEMQPREDLSDAGGQEGFVGVHIGAGQHSEVRGENLQVNKNGNLFSLLRPGQVSISRFVPPLARRGSMS